MRPSFSFHKSVTLFTRPQCGLCLTAKNNIILARQKIAFDFTEVDITDPQNEEWYVLYAYDVPVIHIASEKDSSDFHKIMHRISSETLEECLLDAKKEGSNNRS